MGKAVGDRTSDGLRSGAMGVQRPGGAAGALAEEAWAFSGEAAPFSAAVVRDRTDSMRSGPTDSRVRPPRELNAMEWNPRPRPSPLGTFDFSAGTSCLSTLRLPTTLASAAESAAIERGRGSGDAVVGTASESRLSFPVLFRGLRKRYIEAGGVSSGITGDAKIADRERGRIDLGVPGAWSFRAVLTRRESRGVEAASSGRVGESQLYHQWGASPSLYGVPNDAYLAESVYHGGQAVRYRIWSTGQGLNEPYRCKARGWPQRGSWLTPSELLPFPLHLINKVDGRTNENKTAYTESNHGWPLICSKVGRRDGSFSSIYFKFDCQNISATADLNVPSEAESEHLGRCPTSRQLPGPSFVRIQLVDRECRAQYQTAANGMSGHHIHPI